MKRGTGTKPPKRNEPLKERKTMKWVIWMNRAPFTNYMKAEWGEEAAKEKIQEAEATKQGIYYRLPLFEYATNREAMRGLLRAVVMASGTSGSTEVPLVVIARANQNPNEREAV